MNPSIGLAIFRTKQLIQRLGGIANLTLHGDGKEEVAADLRVLLAAIARAESSQGVDASLVAQQNQEFSSDSGSPTSRRGSHITNDGASE